MPERIDPSVLEPVRALADVMAGFRQLILALAERLEARATEPDGKAPQEGVALLSAELRRIVEGSIGPAAASLQALVERWTPKP